MSDSNPKHLFGGDIMWVAALFDFLDSAMLSWLLSCLFLSENDIPSQSNIRPK